MEVDYLLEELRKSITDLDLDILITFIIGISVIFFGITDDVKNKNFRLKNIFILYISLFIVLIFSISISSIIALITLGFIAGGIILLHDNNNDLEKELNLRSLITYYSIVWSLINKTYIWIICCLFILFVDIDSKVFIHIYDNILWSIPKELFEILIIIIFMLYHYSKIAVSFFDFYSFEIGFKALKLSLIHDKDQSTKQCPHQNILYNEMDAKINFLSFLLYMEDKNMFKRNKPYITFYTDIFKARISNDRKKHFPSIKFNSSKYIKRYNRGYSTIEQQYLRQHILKPNSYRYKIRRTILLKIYTKYFFKSICKRKAMTYSRNKFERRKHQKTLIKNLKFHFLIRYYLDVLNNPKNEEELFKAMSSISRVSYSLYKIIYSQFISSPLLQEYSDKIKDAKDSQIKFLLDNCNETT